MQLQARRDETRWRQEGPADLRQRIASNDIPLPFRGLPVELISAGLMAVAFLGFNAMIKP